MTKQDFSKLVREHGAAWHKAGASSPGVVFDPFRPILIEDAQKLSRKLMEAYDELMQPARNAPFLIDMDLASGLDRTAYACREHINTPHPACPTCAEVARRSAEPQTGDAK